MLETLYKNAINIYVFKIINQSLKQYFWAAVDK